MEAVGERIEPRSGTALQVGDWLVAPDLNQIRRDHEVVQLEPKAMAVLLHLASRPGEVASRDELLAAVWPGVVVGDNALTQAVIKLRKALGDTAREPAYIQAISKKGYRLIATVDRSSNAVLDLPPFRHALPAAPRRGAARWASAALAIAVIAGGAAWYVLREEGKAAAPRSIEARSDSSQIAALPIVIVKPLEAVGEDSPRSLIARAITADLVTDLSKVSVCGSRAGWNIRINHRRARTRLERVTFCRAPFKAMGNNYACMSPSLTSWPAGRSGRNASIATRRISLRCRTIW